MEKNHKVRYIAAALGLIMTAATASAQEVHDGKRYAIRATADFTIGDALRVESALPVTSMSSTARDYGMSFGWTFWTHGKHSFEANFGLGYGRTTLTDDVGDLDYHYNAPDIADMDMDPYIRYYDLRDFRQDILTERIALPLYVSYRYQFSRIFSIHAQLGFKLNYNYKSRVTASAGDVFSYGIYPQYDDLMIDASYMNEFGATTLDRLPAGKPRLNRVIASVLTGVGAEINIYGPIAADVTLRYEAATSNTFRTAGSRLAPFDAYNAPVTYTVAQGQTVKPLSLYLSNSKQSRLSVAVSLICRF